MEGSCRGGAGWWDADKDWTRAGRDGPGRDKELARGAGAAMAPAAEGAGELQVPAAPAAALGRPLSLPGSAWRGRWAEGAAGGADGWWGFLQAWGGETPSGQRGCSWAGQGRGASGE